MIVLLKIFIYKECFIRNKNFSELNYYRKIVRLIYFFLIFQTKVWRSLDMNLQMHTSFRTIFDFTLFKLKSTTKKCRRNQHFQSSVLFDSKWRLLYFCIHEFFVQKQKITLRILTRIFECVR